MARKMSRGQKYVNGSPGKFMQNRHNQSSQLARQSRLYNQRTIADISGRYNPINNNHITAYQGRQTGQSRTSRAGLTNSSFRASKTLVNYLSNTSVTQGFKDLASKVQETYHSVNNFTNKYINSPISNISSAAHSATKSATQSVTRFSKGFYNSMKNYLIGGKREKASFAQIFLN